jgi:hypothetical protein
LEKFHDKFLDNIKKKIQRDLEKFVNKQLDSINGKLWVESQQFYDKELKNVFSEVNEVLRGEVIS